MTIGQRLRRAMERAGLTQKEVALRAGIMTATVSDIVNDRSRPAFDTVERMVRAIGATFGELFDEPRIELPYEDGALVRGFDGLLHRLMENDSAQKAAAKTHPSIRAPRRRGAARSIPGLAKRSTQPESSVIRDAPVHAPNENHEVE